MHVCLLVVHNLSDLQSRPAHLMRVQGVQVFKTEPTDCIISISVVLSVALRAFWWYCGTANCWKGFYEVVAVDPGTQCQEQSRCSSPTTVSVVWSALMCFPSVNPAAFSLLVAVGILSIIKRAARDLVSVSDTHYPQCLAHHLLYLFFPQQHT